MAVSVIAASTVVQTSQESGKSEHFSAIGSVFLDPLGFLLFGPTFGVEIGWGRFSAVAYGRWFDVGVMSKSTLTNKDNAFAFSYGGGIKGRYYFRPNFVGPQFGLGMEFLKTRTETNVFLVAFNHTFLVPELEGGYRFDIGRFYIGASAGIGYLFQISKSAVNINGGQNAQNFEAYDMNTICGSASLDLGMLF